MELIQDGSLKKIFVLIMQNLTLIPIFTLFAVNVRVMLVMLFHVMLIVLPELEVALVEP